LFAALLCADAGSSTTAGAANMHTPDTLRARYSALQPQLRNNQFQRPLHLNSSETANGVNGDIHALIGYPFATVVAALNSPGQWCDIMMLHLNTKHCRAAMAGQENLLKVSIGKKHDQPLDEAYPVVFAYRVATQSPDYLQVTLNADEGPLSTRDYRIVLEAIPLDKNRTFIHLSYAYAYGITGRLAIQAYLGTTGRDKVGFTVTGSPLISAARAVWWNATPCVITWPSKPISAPFRHRHRHDSKNACRTGSQPASVIRASCMKWNGMPIST
jgi:hypothetical protein